MLFFTRWCALVVCLSALAGEIPEPTGPHAVGRVVYRWIDAARAEPLSSRGDDRREVTVWISYPTNEVGAGTAAYVEDLARLEAALPKDQVALVSSVKTHTIGGALLSPDRKRYPVLLFSPGAGSSPALYTTIIEHLVSHGYVVAAVDHPYDSAAVILMDGRVVQQVSGPKSDNAVLGFDRDRTNTRAQDLLFVRRQLDELNRGKSHDHRFRGRLDLARSAAFGHSSGGKAAAHACLRNDGLIACAIMDGFARMLPAHAEDAGSGFRQPFLLIQRTMSANAMPGEQAEAAHRLSAELRERSASLLRQSANGRSYRISLDGATHAAFSDEEVIVRSPDDPESKRFGTILRTVAELLQAFFDETLAHKRGSVLRIAESGAGVKLESFGSR